MTIDRLIQMKEYVKSQFKGLMFTGDKAHEMNLLNDIYMLITAEIERQSVTDDEVPCDWCKETNGFMPLDFVHSSIATIDGEDRPVIFWHCPNCGRELGVSDEHAKTNKATD